LALLRQRFGPVLAELVTTSPTSSRRALRPGSDTTVTGVPASPSSPSRTITAGAWPASTLHARRPTRSCRSAAPAALAAQPPAHAAPQASPRWLAFALKLVGRCGEPPDLDHLQAMRQASVHQAAERGLVLHRAVQHHLRRLHADRQAPGLELECGQDRVDQATSKADLLDSTTKGHNRLPSYHVESDSGGVKWWRSGSRAVGSWRRSPRLASSAAGDFARRWTALRQLPS
jgi:hypothetical protein